MAGSGFRSREQAVSEVSARLDATPGVPGHFDCPVCGKAGAVTLEANAGIVQVLASCGCPRGDVKRAKSITPRLTGYTTRADIVRHPAAAADPDPENDPWDPPIEFGTPQADEFPVHLFPPTYRDFCLAVAETAQVPVDLPATMVLAVVAGCVAKKVSAYLGGDHREPPVVYMLTPMEPGNRKSFSFGRVTQPVYEWERRLVEKANADLTERRAMASLRKKDLARLEEKAAKLGPNGGPDRADLEDEIKALAREIDDLDPDAEAPTLIMDDTTAETLVSKMAVNGAKMMVLSDEGEIFGIMAGRYQSGGGSPNLNVFLKGWSAQGELRVHRRGRAEILPDPALTLGISPQPETLRGLTKQREFRGRGLLGRIMYCLPQSKLGRRKIKTDPIPPDVANGYRNAVRRLLDLKPETWTDEQTGATTEYPREYQADREAQRLLDGLRAQLEPKLAPHGELGHIQTWASKLAGSVGRLALLLELMHQSDPAERPPAEWQNPDEWLPQPAWIDASRMAAAIRLGEYFTAHALAAFEEMGVGEETENARDLLDIIETWGRDRFSGQEIWQKAKSRQAFSKAANLYGSLDFLVERGWLRTVDVPSNGTKARRPDYVVNPELWERKARRAQAYKQPDPTGMADDVLADSPFAADGAAGD